MEKIPFEDKVDIIFALRELRDQYAKRLDECVERGEQPEEEGRVYWANRLERYDDLVERTKVNFGWLD